MSERFDERAWLRAITAQAADAGTNAASGEESSSPLLPVTNIRKVRQIVTASGRGVRGYFPGKKAEGRARFESLIEEDALRLMEIASCVTSYKTQPRVLVLSDARGQFTYTPDVAVRTRKGDVHYLEVKPNLSALSKTKIRRLRRILNSIRPTQHCWGILLESDVRQDGLQEELKTLCKLRPAPGRLPSVVDHRLWDPLQRIVPDEQTAARWAAAQDTCDQLLTRLMRRDPRDPLDAVSA
jgi:hypothetical protein